MRQKYEVLSDNRSDQLIIRQYAEIEKDVFVLSNEEAFAISGLHATASRGAKALAATLRTADFFPPQQESEKLAALAIDLLQSGNQDVTELVLDDMDFVSHTWVATGRSSGTRGSAATEEDIYDSDVEGIDSEEDLFDGSGDADLFSAESYPFDEVA